MAETIVVKYSNDIKQEALYYTSIGLPVIPLCTPSHEGMDENHRHRCKSPGKAPVLKGWPKHSETTAADIHRWFSMNQFFNIGVPLGSPSELIGIDIDGAEGEKILKELSKGDVPSTWEFTTGKGRRLLYKLPLGMQTKKMKFVGKKPNEEFAIICDGQQTVIPPSRHSSGRLYKWSVGPREMEQPASVPQWIIDQIQIDDQGQRILKEETGEASPEEEIKKPPGKVTSDDWDAVLSKGERNDEITKRAGSLIGRGMSKDAVISVLKLWNMTHCKPPLPEDEIETIVVSVAMAEDMKGTRVTTKAGVVKVIFKPTPFSKLFINKQKDIGYSWKYSSVMGCFYRCNDLTGPWERLDIDYVKSLLRDLLRDENKGGDLKWDSIHYVAESIEALKSRLVEPGEKYMFDLGQAIQHKNYKYDPIKIACLQNGVLEWETLKLHPWDSDIYTTIVLPVNWNAEAKCPNWIDSLNQWIPDKNSIEFLQEFVGLCLIPDTSFRTAVFLYGSGSNGKSMFLDTIRTLFGASLVSIPLHRLTDRFETANLQNRLINICGDIDSKYISETGVLKAIIGGDELHGEFKHGASFWFRPVCRLMFSANALPQVKDKSVAWYSRWQFIEFPKTFPVDPAWKIQYTKIFEEEKEGIFKWAIEGLTRLKANNKWTESCAMMESETEYRLSNDNVMAFLFETTEKLPDRRGPEQIVSTSALHEFYRGWIDTRLSGSKPVGQIEFSRRLQSLGYEKTVRKINNKSANVFLGMNIKEEYKSDYGQCAQMISGGFN